MGHEIGSKRPGWMFPSGPILEALQKLVDLDTRLLAVLHDGQRPLHNQERLAFAGLSQKYKKHYTVAAGFYADAFAADPKLADDLQAGTILGAIDVTEAR